MKVDWATFKAFVDSQALSIQSIDYGDYYFLEATANGSDRETTIVKAVPATSDQTDFETNYLPSANMPQQSKVVTDFELNNKTLKMVSASAAVQADGSVVVSIKVPGVFSGLGAGPNGRFVDAGVAWFDTHDKGDRVMEISIVDVDGTVLGAGAGYVAQTYHDSEADLTQQGWRIPQFPGWIEVETIGGYGFIPSGLTLQIKAQKGITPVEAGEMFNVNISWGKKDGPGPV